MRKLTFILLPLICLTLSCNSNQQSETAPTTEAPTIATGETSPEKTATPPATSGMAQRSEVKELPKVFPKIYVDAGLPDWKKANIDHVNELKNGADTRYQLVLSSSEDIHAIAKYYDGAMKKSGWTPTNMSKRAQKENRRSMTFRKDGDRFMINILNIPDQENRIITMMFGDDLK